MTHRLDQVVDLRRGPRRGEAIDLRREKLPIAKQARIRALWLGGKNANQISKLVGVQYRTAWLWVKRLEAGDA